MSRFFDLVDAAAPGDALWPAAPIPAAFVVCIVVRFERWYSLIPQAVEAIRSRIAGRGES